MRRKPRGITRAVIAKPLVLLVKRTFLFGSASRAQLPFPDCEF